MDYAEYGIAFQKKLLFFFLQDLDFLHSFITLVKPEYFQDETLRLAVHAAISFHTENHEHRLTKTAFLTEASRLTTLNGFEAIDENVLENVWDESLSFDPTDRTYMETRVVEFARNQEYVRLILNGAEELGRKKPDLAKIHKMFMAALETGNQFEDHGSVYFEESVDRFRSYLRDPKEKDEPGVPLGFPLLDARIAFGKVFAGEMLVVAAPMGRYKTTTLLNLVANVLAMPNQVVIYYSGEVSEKKIALRMDAMLTGIDAMKLHEGVYAKRALNQLGQLYKTNKSFLLVKRFQEGTASILDLQAHLQHIKSLYGVTPTLIVIDYIEHMRHLEKLERYDLTIAHTYRQCRAWGEREHCPIFTASQLTRKSINKYHTDQQDLAEAISKAAIADILITVCQDEEEYDSHVLRMFFAKNRESPARVEYIQFKVDYPRFIEQGVLSRNG